MFRPERMCLMQIAALDEDLISACACLVERNVVHLVDRTLVAPTLREGTPAFFAETQTELEALNEQLQAFAVLLGSPVQGEEMRAQAPRPKIDPQQAVADIKPRLAEALGALRGLQTQREQTQREIKRLTDISDTLQSVASAGVRYSDLRALRFFGVVTGIMPLRVLPTLRRSLHEVPYHLEVRPLGHEEISVIVIYPADVKQNVEGTLKSVYFTEVVIPDEWQGDAAAALDDIEMRLWQLREEAAELTRSIRAQRKADMPSYFAWRQAVRANLRVLSAMQLFGKTARTTFINGWVPVQRAAAITKDLEDALGGRVMVETSTPDEAGTIAGELMRLGKVRVPTKFRHPAFLKPFETLVTTYGYPDYDGIDPTFFVAISFLLMFGMMFGDVGHGLVLAAVGAALVRIRALRILRNAGWLLIAAGASATVFGFLFDSMFGVEHFMEPVLWFAPMENIPRMLITALSFGILVITLGVMLNIVQAFSRRNVKEALFGQWGIVSGTFYWTALLLFYLAVVKDRAPSAGVIVAVLVAPIALVVLGDIFYDRLFGGSAPHEEEGEHSVAEIIFKPVEIVLNYMTHTVSFMRVGAFALNHAALMMVVYVIAQMGGGMTGPDATAMSRANYLLSAVVGNVFVVLLEGLVVFIQCLRLEYYEFFSKFYAGEGVRYEPLQVEDV
ncbi:hypothetical protein GX586_06970 [bacterium]|nr:hypothetical protein [bacterium]